MQRAARSWNNSRFSNLRSGALETHTLQKDHGNSVLVRRISPSTGTSADGIKQKPAAPVPVLLHDVLANGLFTTRDNLTGKTLPNTGSLVQAITGQLIH